MRLDANLWQWFRERPRDRELREVREEWEATERLWRASPLGQNEDALQPLALALLTASWDRHGQPRLSISLALDGVLDDLLRLESIGAITPLWEEIDASVAGAVEFRQMLIRRRQYVTDFRDVHAAVTTQLDRAVDALYRALPPAAFARQGKEGTFDVPLIELVEQPAELVHTLATFPYAAPAMRRDLFHELRERLRPNLMVASGLPPDTTELGPHDRIIFPGDQERKTGAELADLYLSGTPLRRLLDVPVPFEVPEAARFEHCHIVGGTGHGKTQLLQRLILGDLQTAQTERRSVVVVDSQGDLITKITRLALFDPDAPQSLADRVILIDPTDVEYPASLNLFDAPVARLSSYGALERERALNGVIETYETFFGDLLGAELTQKQGVIFRYLAHLMLVIPGSTIHTLMRLMDDGQPFRPHMVKLPGSARYFFEQEFFHPSFAATKRQIVKRLWGVLATPAFERMFAQPTNKLDLFTALNRGNVILVNTAKDLLKDEGSRLFGRFFLARLKQATLERAALPESERTPTFVYVDEAQEYFDDTTETMLTQSRKYNVAYTAAHQTLDQLSPRLRAAFHANTSLKMAGGVSARDARALAEELRTSAAFLESMQRRGDQTEFAVWLKQVTPRAIRLSVPLGHLERQPTLAEEAYDALRARNRERYCGTLADVGSLYEDARTSASPEHEGADGRSGTGRSATDPIHVTIHTSERTDVPTASASPRPRPAVIFLPDLRAAAPSPSTAPDGSPPRRPRAPPGSNASDFRSPQGAGKGGPKHRYLQNLVRELAEMQGLRAVLEAPLPDGSQVDVLVSRGDLRLAVEVSVTTPASWERENIRKALRAGVSQVALVIAKSGKTPARYQAAVLDGLSSYESSAITFLLPEDLPDFLASFAPAAPPEETIIKGWKVKVSRTQVSPEDAKRRRDELARLVAKSLRDDPRAS